jgi:hypothetical protein
MTQFLRRILGQKHLQNASIALGLQKSFSTAMATLKTPKQTLPKPPPPPPFRVAICYHDDAIQCPALPRYFLTETLARFEGQKHCSVVIKILFFLPLYTRYFKQCLLIVLLAVLLQAHIAVKPTLWLLKLLSLVNILIDLPWFSITINTLLNHSSYLCHCCQCWSNSVRLPTMINSTNHKVKTRF